MAQTAKEKAASAKKRAATTKKNKLEKEKAAASKKRKAAATRKANLAGGKKKKKSSGGAKAKAKNVAKKIVYRVKQANKKAKPADLVKMAGAIVIMLLLLQKIKNKFAHKNVYMMAGVPIVAGSIIWFTKFAKKEAWIRALAATMVAGGAVIGIAQITQVKKWLGDAGNAGIAGYLENNPYDLEDPEQYQVLAGEIYRYANEVTDDDIGMSGLDEENEVFSESGASNVIRQQIANDPSLQGQGMFDDETDEEMFA